MVIRIIIEGGNLSQEDVNSVNKGTLSLYDGSEVLREELQKFFINALGFPEISVIVNYEGANKNAAKAFAAKSNEDYLYTDLDDVPEKRAEWFCKMETDGIIIPQDRRKNVFFWIKEMEAWFLKQPQSIENWAADRGIEVKTPIALDPLIAEKDIEHLTQKPSDVMRFLFNRHIKNPRAGKNGKPQKVKYHKMRIAPRLIPYLDPHHLKKVDIELQSFVNSVHEKIESNTTEY